MRNQLNFFEFKFGKNIKFFEFGLTKILSLLFDLIAFFLLTCCFFEFGKTTDFFRVLVRICSPSSKYGFVVFYREFTKLAPGVSFFVLVASAVATVEPGVPHPPLTTACAPPLFRFAQNAFLEHHVTTRQQAVTEKTKNNFQI